MSIIKEYPNGLKVVITSIEGLLSVSCGILVKTGSINESSKENGISHFIEHNLFKGTKTRTSFEISDEIDRIGAQINAFTSKELTCYYTKSTSEHFEKSFEILSDIFCNSIFSEQEIEKEKGVVLEEINMSEDTPEDLCLDLLAKGYYGDKGLGRTILGKEKNIKSFTRNDILNYLQKYYLPNNIVISIAGKVDTQNALNIIEKYFLNNLPNYKGGKQVKSLCLDKPNHLYKYKKIEQSHISYCFNGTNMFSDDSDSLAIANIIFGGGMSSRLFQKIREELGLCYSVYSYASQYKDSGVIEIYAGVNTKERDKASDSIISELKTFSKNGISKDEFLRGKEQIKSSFILGQESGASQMILYGKYLLFLNKKFDFYDRIKKIDNVTFDNVNEVINKYFNVDKITTATVGPIKKSLII